jgi:hypothetical protein
MHLDGEPYRAPMRIVRESSEAEVVAAFLRAELDSSRYRDTVLALLDEVGEDERLLRSPTITDASENKLRATLLDRYRGWLGRQGLFGGFPKRVDWLRVALTRDEVLAILYINWDWWLRVSGGSRRPLDAATRIRAGDVPGSTVEEHEPIAARLRSPDPPPELIVVAPPDHARLVLLEGHFRLTAYALFPEWLPEPLEVFLGTSASISRWGLF